MRCKSPGVVYSTWVNLNGTGDTWAPDVSYRNGQWFMYYAVSSFGSNRSAIGRATSPSGNPGTWTDHGKVIESFSYHNYNAILVTPRGARVTATGAPRCRC